MNKNQDTRPFISADSFIGDILALEFHSIPSGRAFIEGHAKDDMCRLLQLLRTLKDGLDDGDEYAKSGIEILELLGFMLKPRIEKMMRARKKGNIDGDVARTLAFRIEAAQEIKRLLDGGTSLTEAYKLVAKRAECSVGKIQEAWGTKNRGRS